MYKFTQKIFLSAFLIIAAIGIMIGAMVYWVNRPIIGANDAAIPFSIAQGSTLNSAIAQIHRAGMPVNSQLLSWWIRFNQNSGKLKAGDYSLKPGTTPTMLMVQLVKGEFVLLPVTIVEGWTFRQMRQTLGKHEGLKQETAGLCRRRNGMELGVE